MKRHWYRVDEENGESNLPNPLLNLDRDTIISFHHIRTWIHIYITLTSAYTSLQQHLPKSEKRLIIKKLDILALHINTSEVATLYLGGECGLIHYSTAANYIGSSPM